MGDKLEELFKKHLGDVLLKMEQVDEFQTGQLSGFSTHLAKLTKTGQEI